MKLRYKFTESGPVNFGQFGTLLEDDEILVDEDIAAGVSQDDRFEPVAPASESQQFAITLKNGQVEGRSVSAGEAGEGEPEGWEGSALVGFIEPIGNEAVLTPRLGLGTATELFVDLRPSVANGASAVAFTLGTENALANDGAKLVSILNDGVEQLSLSRNGGLMIGPSTLAYWTELAVDGSVLVAHHDVAASEPNRTAIELSTANGAALGEVSIAALSTAANVLFQAADADSLGRILAQVGSGSTTLSLRYDSVPTTTVRDFSVVASDTALRLELTVGATIRTSLNPMVADGASAVAYLFDTSNVLEDDGARLVIVRNNGVEGFAIRRTGGITVADNAAQADGLWGETNVLLLVRDTNSDIGDLSTLVSVINEEEEGTEVSCATIITGTNTLVARWFTATEGDVTSEMRLDLDNASTLQWRLVVDGDTVVAFNHNGDASFEGDMQISGDITGVNAIVSLSTVTGSAFHVGANQVLGARIIDARIDDAINSGDATTDGVIDALRDALIAHGLCTAA